MLGAGNNPLHPSHPPEGAFAPASPHEERASRLPHLTSSPLLPSQLHLHLDTWLLQPATNVSCSVTAAAAGKSKNC